MDVTAIEPSDVCTIAERLTTLDGVWNVRQVYVRCMLPVMHYIRMTQASSKKKTYWGKDRSTGDFILRETPQGKYLTIQKGIRSVLDTVMSRNGIQQLGEKPLGFEGQIWLMKHRGQKPDIDNLYKGLFDCLNKSLWVDDRWVTEYSYNHRPIFVQNESECGFECIVTEFLDKERLTMIGVPTRLRDKFYA